MSPGAHRGERGPAFWSVGPQTRLFLLGIAEIARRKRRGPIAQRPTLRMVSSTLPTGKNQNAFSVGRVQHGALRRQRQQVVEADVVG